MYPEIREKVQANLKTVIGDGKLRTDCLRGGKLNVVLRCHPSAFTNRSLFVCPKQLENVKLKEGQEIAHKRTPRTLKSPWSP